MFFWGPYVVQSYKQARSRSQPDPHYQVSVLNAARTDHSFMLDLKVMIRNYKEVPWYWYFGLLILAFFAGMSVQCFRPSVRLTRRV